MAIVPKAGRVLAALSVVWLAVSLSPAQAPDCTDISDVSDFDGSNVSDFDGLLTTVRVASGLLRPLFVTSPPGDTERLFIVEQDGTIRILKNGSLLPQPFLDISAFVRSPADGGNNEEGLLGLAFHPDYDTNGWLFVYYTNNTGNTNEVWRFTRDANNADLADITTRQLVLPITHDFAGNHNGGMIAFRPTDGYLYIGTGDGGGGCDPQNTGQDLTSNLGKLLRINVDSLPYSTTGNPFDGPTAGNDEIWDYGLRNPYRFSFDRDNGNIYIGDVGQNQWEEIDCERVGLPGGLNFGWDAYEGSFCPNPSCGTVGSCMFPNVKPIVEYDHSTAGFSCSVTGGYVYRGCRMSDLHGTYFYADFCSDFIRTFETNLACGVANELDRTADLAPGGGLNVVDITSFGEDARGEIYIVDRGGEVFKVLPVLTVFELSGPNAPLFIMGADWSWEDLEVTAGHPIASYKVYRSTTGPTGPFTCAFEGPDAFWPGGDPDLPPVGVPYFYLTTALNGAGEETRPGNQSDGTPRTVDTGSGCP